MSEHCQVPRCRSVTYLLKYLGKRVCEKCWRKYMAEDQPDDALRKKLGIEDR